MSDPIIYLHIPKTAGTSFRISAADYFGEDNVLYDYGADSSTTSEELLNSVESEESMEKIRVAGLRAKMLGGHFSFPKYRNLFPDSPVVSFFRDPVDRVVSEYVHFSNHYHYDGTLEDFYRSPRFQNRQHKSLGGAKPTDLDFFGLTERYERSLELFNKKYDTGLKVVALNKGNYGTKSQRIEPSRQHREEIRHLNQADVALYQLAVDQFDRQDLNRTIARVPVTRYIGNLGGIRQEKLYGWVFDNESSRPASVRICVNGEKRLETQACLERPDIVRSGLREDPRCGFIVSVSELGPIKTDDSISIQTADGSYELINSPLIYAA